MRSILISVYVDLPVCLSVCLSACPFAYLENHASKFSIHVSDVTRGRVCGDAVPLKRSLSVEVKAWRNLICRQMNIRYKSVLSEIDSFMDEVLAQLARPIKDLEDVRQAMAVLESVRYRQLEIDSTLGPIEARHCRSQLSVVNLSSA